MSAIIPEQTTRFVRSFADSLDETVLEMERYEEDHGPPTIGREVGQLLHVLTELTSADASSSSGRDTATPRTGSHSEFLRSMKWC